MTGDDLMDAHAPHQYVVSDVANIISLALVSLVKIVANYTNHTFVRTSVQRWVFFARFENNENAFNWTVRVPAERWTGIITTRAAHRTVASIRA